MWILPTLNRLTKLKVCLKSLKDTRTTTQGLVVTDEQDYAANKAEYDSLEMPESFKLRVTKAVSMGDKCRELWPEVSNSEWVGLLNDDHFFVTSEWDKKLIAKLDGKNFAHANDRWAAPMKATTATIWSMPLLKALDWPIYPPLLQHLFIDDVWENLGMHTGTWRPVMSVVVEHHHVVNGRGAMDQTHEKVYSQKSWDMDHAVFQNFLKHDLTSCVDKIRKFQNFIPGQRFNPEYKPVISEK